MSARLPLPDCLTVDFELSGLTGADYNPRAIDEHDLEALRESLRSLGIVKPIIERNGIIVAGHQRTKALRASGIERAPVVSLSRDTTNYDEVRFNQQHNETDLVETGGPVTVRGGFEDQEVGTWVCVPGKSVTGDPKSNGALLRESIAGLMAKYGSWGSCVALKSGDIIHAQQTALTARTVGQPLLVYVLPDHLAPQALAALTRKYGRHCYDHLKRDTFMQTFAQPYRPLDKKGKGGVKIAAPSRLYEKWLIPLLEQERGLRALDFGCGHGDYVNKCQGAGHNVIGMEFFRRKWGTNSIDVKAVHRMIDMLCLQLEKRGRFDVVVADFVLNSVDSVQAETDVLNSLTALCKPGGTIMVSGRFPVNKQKTKSYSTGGDIPPQYLDPDTGLSASYRKGRWFFQMFHTRERLVGIRERMGWELVEDAGLNETSVQWWMRCINGAPGAAQPDPEALVASLRREFSMPYNDEGDRYERGDSIEAAIRPRL